jgi:hypothetical protein
MGDAVHAYDGPVEKKTFTLPTYTTVGGQDDQGREGRPKEVRQAERCRRRRDLRPALLERYVARR